MLEKFKKIFDARHDFEDEDLDILKERWPSVKFHNIPVAWIVPIDEMLCRMRLANPVKEVRQEFGQFIVIHGSNKANHASIIRTAEKKIYSIDEDLHEGLKYGNA